LPFLDEIDDAFAKTDGELEVPEKVQSKKLHRSPAVASSKRSTTMDQTEGS
jgi:hypothetical protein